MNMIPALVGPTCNPQPRDRPRCRRPIPRANGQLLRAPRSGHAPRTRLVHDQLAEYRGPKPQHHGSAREELREAAWIQRRSVQPRAELAGAAVPYIDEGEIGFGPPWSRPGAHFSSAVDHQQYVGYTRDGTGGTAYDTPITAGQCPSYHSIVDSL